MLETSHVSIIFHHLWSCFTHKMYQQIIEPPMTLTSFSMFQHNISHVERSALGSSGPVTTWRINVLLLGIQLSMTSWESLGSTTHQGCWLINHQDDGDDIVWKKGIPTKIFICRWVRSKESWSEICWWYFPEDSWNERYIYLHDYHEINLEVNLPIPWILLI